MCGPGRNLRLGPTLYRPGCHPRSLEVGALPAQAPPQTSPRCSVGRGGRNSRELESPPGCIGKSAPLCHPTPACPRDVPGWLPGQPQSLRKPLLGIQALPGLCFLHLCHLWLWRGGWGPWAGGLGQLSCPDRFFSLNRRGPAGQHSHQVPALLPGHGGEGPLLSLWVPGAPHLLEP